VPEIFPLALGGDFRTCTYIIDDAYIVIALRKKGKERYSSLSFSIRGVSTKENASETTKSITRFDFSEGRTASAGVDIMCQFATNTREIKNQILCNRFATFALKLAGKSASATYRTGSVITKKTNKRDI